MSTLEIILHVGTHKTGTTSIQNFIYQNPTLMAKNGILYPSTGLNMSQPEVGIRHDFLCYGLDDAYVGDVLIGRLTDEIDTFASKLRNVVILSCESWSWMRNREQRNLQSLVSSLKSSYPNARVRGVCCFLNYHDYITKLHGEMVRRHGEQKYIHGWISTCDQGYNRIAACLSSVFSDITFTTSVKETFTALTGLDSNINKLPHCNTSLELGEVEVIRRINSLLPSMLTESQINTLLENLNIEHITRKRRHDPCLSKEFAEITGFSEKQLEFISR